MTVGENIKKIRTELRLTQVEFSEKVGISRNALINYESNKRQPSISMLTQIANEFDISTSKLIEPTENSLSIGEKIRKYRKQQNLTMKQLGERLDITEQAVSQYERNIRTPNTKSIFKISEILGIEPSKIDEDLNIISKYNLENLGNSTSYNPIVIEFSPFEVGEILKKTRLKLNLTQQQVGYRLNIPRTTYANYEGNNRKVDCEFIRKFCDEFRCNYEEFSVGKLDMSQIPTQDLIEELMKRKDFKIKLESEE